MESSWKSQVVERKTIREKRQFEEFFPSLLVDLNDHYYSYGVSCLLKSTLYTLTDPPRVTIRMGKSLVASDIREGVDVYFNCVIVANPAPKTKIVTWLHNVSNFLVCIFPPL